FVDVDEIGEKVRDHGRSVGIHFTSLCYLVVGEAGVAGHVQPHHRHGEIGFEDDLGGFGVGEDVELLEQAGVTLPSPIVPPMRTTCSMSLTISGCLRSATATFVRGPTGAMWSAPLSAAVSTIVSTACVSTGATAGSGRVAPSR